MTAQGLPTGTTVFERGWLSSNNVLLVGDDRTALVDTGYATHMDQTLALVRRGLGGRPLDLVANTHLHSDHCGGNAVLQRAFPAVLTMIPPGHADAVREWDAVALTYAPTGQRCERFSFGALLQPGSEIRLGPHEWQVHAAPGHDPHSVILFEPRTRTLISADALWENGFGVVFPELEGVAAFDEVAATLDEIERLEPAWVIPGHGSVFGGADRVTAALARARSRLEGFVRDPSRHGRHAAKVLLKFKLLELQQAPWNELADWALKTPYFQLLIGRYCDSGQEHEWLRSLAEDLVKAGAAKMVDGRLLNV